MNILNNLSPLQLLVRPFTEPRWDLPLSTDIYKVVKPVCKLFGPDPQYVQYGPFSAGYDITFTLTSPADLRYLAEQNLLTEVVVADASGRFVQIGSEEGFKLTGIIPPAAPGRDLFVYTFKTVKPHSQTFKLRKYEQK